MQRSVNFFFIFLFFLSIPSAFAGKAEKPALILKARLFKIESFSPSSGGVDALDQASMQQGMMPSAVVSFLIKDVIRGELPVLKTGYPSTWSQMKDAANDKSFLKILTLDFKNPEAEREDRPKWFLVGVQSPLDSFNVLSWKELPAQDYRLEFTRRSKEDGWILLSAKPLS